MTRTGKIARLPREIRDQLNRRLEDGQSANPILDWLNSLPQTHSLIAADFNNTPISPQNLSEWRSGGFRDWQAQQAALRFAQDLDADDAALQPLLGAPLTEKLARWIALRYAAAAHSIATADPDDPEIEFRRLRNFCLDIVALRRGDLNASRLNLEQQRLAILKSQSAEERELQFWEWSKRPDVQAKLYPNRDPDQIRDNVVKLLDHRLLGVCQSAPEPLEASWSI